MEARHRHGFFKPQHTTSHNVFFSFATLYQFISFLSLAKAFTLYYGVPANGNDLCDGDTRCDQGYIYSLNESYIYQFYRHVRYVGAVSEGTTWQLKDCLTLEKVGNALYTAILQNHTGNTTASCSAISSEFQGAKATSYVVEASKARFQQSMCDTFKTNFQSVANDCMDGGKAFGYDLAVGLMILAGMIVLAVSIAGASRLNKHCSQVSFNCCKKSEEENESDEKNGTGEEDKPSPQV